MAIHQQAKTIKAVALPFVAAALQIMALSLLLQAYWFEHRLSEFSREMEWPY